VRAPLWPVLAAAGLACAAVPPLPAGTSAQPALGDPLGLIVTKLHYADGAPADIDVREVRMLAIDQQPWRTIDAATAAALPGTVGVVAGRRCHWRDGLTGHDVDRGSWFLLRGGALYAYDHTGFGARCAELPAFDPVPLAEVGIERELVRYLSQRWPIAEVNGEQRAARGLALVARGRSDDAIYELNAIDRRLAELARRQTEEETPDAAKRESLRQEEERLRPLRAQLAHALEERARAEEVEP